MMISEIQHFSTGNGPGIRTTVFFKGCSMHCPWCHNPETIPFGPTRMDYPDLNKTEWCGKEITAEEILSEILEDRDYYEESGGGATFSGGEAMLQFREAAGLAQKLKEAGISLVVDTAGNVPYEAFAQMNPYVDCYLYDVKCVSSEQLMQVTGGDGKRILENLKRLLQDGKQVRIRIPLIPGFNTARESVEELCQCLTALGVKEVDLLRFHRMGAGKYEAMSMSYAYAGVPLLETEEVKRIRTQYERYFKVCIEH